MSQYSQYDSNPFCERDDEDGFMDFLLKSTSAASTSMSIDKTMMDGTTQSAALQLSIEDLDRMEPCLDASKDGSKSQEALAAGTLPLGVVPPPARKSRSMTAPLFLATSQPLSSLWEEQDSCQLPTPLSFDGESDMSLDPLSLALKLDPVASMAEQARRSQQQEEIFMSDLPSNLPLDSPLKEMLHRNQGGQLSPSTTGADIDLMHVRTKAMPHPILTTEDLFPSLVPSSHSSFVDPNQSLGYNLIPDFAMHTLQSSPPALNQASPLTPSAPQLFQNPFRSLSAMARDHGSLTSPVSSPLASFQIPEHGDGQSSTQPLYPYSSELFRQQMETQSNPLQNQHQELFISPLPLLSDH